MYRPSPEIVILRYGGGVAVQSRGGAGYYTNTGELARFSSSNFPDSGKVSCLVRGGQTGVDAHLTADELRLLSSQLAVLADCIEAQEKERLTMVRREDALRRLTDDSGSGT